MRARRDLDAPGLDGRVVERRPDLQLGVAVDAPEDAAVLVPRQVRSPVAALVIKMAR